MMNQLRLGGCLWLLVTLTTSAEAEPLAKADGFRGIWYSIGPSKDEYAFKYSGGFATYPQQHSPQAIYRPEVKKTFFVYGGTTARQASDKQELLHLISYFDHQTGQIARPRLLLNKKTDDAHDNPILVIDDKGYLYFISPAHGLGRPAFVHRSKQPYQIDDFERVYEGNFSYAQAWWQTSGGILLLHTRYTGKDLGVKGDRCLGWLLSDGKNWTGAKPVAAIVRGDYQISWPCGQRVATAFDFHPTQLGVDARTNIYYLETADQGKTWTKADGTPVTLPVTEIENPALIYDARKDHKLVYLKDINFDAAGHPVIMFLTSGGYESGPKNDPREWKTMRWTGKDWVTRTVTTSDSNYDHGSLYIEPDGTWRVIAPTEPGPQPYNPGGEMVLWTSQDQGQTWKRVKQLTQNSELNHTYARRPLNADPGFYAFWADGHGRHASESHLYFTDREGSHVWRLPAKMDSDFAKPEVAW